MVKVNANFMLKNPTQEKLVELINDKQINNHPLFIYTIHTNEVSPSSDLYEIIHNEQSYYFFANNVRKTLAYNIDMLPNLINTHTVFITDLLL